MLGKSQAIFILKYFVAIGNPVINYLVINKMVTM